MQKKNNISALVLQCFHEHGSPLTTDQIQQKTKLTTKQIQDATHRLTKPNSKRPARLRRTEEGTYERIPDTETSTPTKRELPTPPPVPTDLPDANTSLENFQIQQHNREHLWKLHKSITNALRVITPFGDTIPAPDTLKNDPHAMQYAEAVKTYIIATRRYQQDLKAFEKEPNTPLSQRARETVPQQKETSDTEQLTFEPLEQDEPTNFTFAGETFDTFAELENAIELILKKSKLNTALEGADQAIVYELLRYHPNAKVLGTGSIHHFEVQRANKNDPNSRKFYLVKEDNTISAFSQKKSIQRYKDGHTPATLDA